MPPTINLPPVKVDRFLGYTSKDPVSFNNPALASECQNLIINNGDLCNLPFPINRIVAPRQRLMGTAQKFIFTGTDLDRRKRVRWPIWYNAFTSNITLLKDSPKGLLSPIVIVSQDNLDGFSPDYGFNFDFDRDGLTRTRLLDGNFLQIGHWVYLLTLAGPPQMRISPGPAGNADADDIARMIKFKYDGDFNNNPTFGTTLVGVRRPGEVTEGADGAGSLDADTWGFAVSIVNSRGEANDEMVSNAKVADFTYVSVGSKSVILNVEMPYNQIEPGVTHLRVFTSKLEQSEYYFNADFAIGPGSIVGQTISITVTSSTQDLLIPAETVRNAVPRPSIHAAEFKGRMYYMNATYDDSSAVWPINQMQYSRVFSGDGNAIEANYIEGAWLVGDSSEALTGVIDFLGQLVIFKERSTWILSDSILVDQPRILFSDIGCISKNAGRAFTVLNETLYWADENGIYSYNGSEPPIKISFIIEEDLNAIDNDIYRRMRFSTDKRYNLLYITFPVDNPALHNVKTFIYNYVEGVWTTGPSKYAQVLEFSGFRHSDKPIVFASNEEIELLGTLDDPGILGTIRIWSYKSSRLGLTDPDRVKHFKLLKLFSNIWLNKNVWTEEESEQAFVFFLGNGGFVTYFKDGRVYIGRNLKNMTIDITAGGGPSLTWAKPFRIHGLQLDVHDRGRR